MSLDRLLPSFLQVRSCQIQPPYRSGWYWQAHHAVSRSICSTSIIVATPMCSSTHTQWRVVALKPIAEERWNDRSSILLPSGTWRSLSRAIVDASNCWERLGECPAYKPGNNTRVHAYPLYTTTIALIGQIKKKGLKRKVTRTEIDHPIAKLKVWVLYPISKQTTPISNTTTIFPKAFVSIQLFSKNWNQTGSGNRYHGQLQRSCWPPLKNGLAARFPRSQSLWRRWDHRHPGASVIHELEKNRSSSTRGPMIIINITTSKIPTKKAFDKAESIQCQMGDHRWAISRSRGSAKTRRAVDH